MSLEPSVGYKIQLRKKFGFLVFLHIMEIAHGDTSNGPEMRRPYLLH